MTLQATYPRRSHFADTGGAQQREQSDAADDPGGMALDDAEQVQPPVQTCQGRRHGSTHWASVVQLRGGLGDQALTPLGQTGLCS